MMTGEEGLDSSLTRCFFSLIMDLARSYIDIFVVDGVMGGVGLKETGESVDEGICGIDGGVEGVKGGCWEIRTAGGGGGIKGGGDEGI